MKTDYIPYQKTGYFTKTILDYLENSSELKDFYQFPVEIESFKSALIQKSKHEINRELLVEVLEEQYSKIQNIGGTLNEKVKSGIQSLKENQTFTVTTGHQLNILGGPLYTIYKILSTIKLAEELNAASENKYKIIPIFWLATEDHDFAEINHLNFSEKTIRWDLEAWGAVGRLSTETFSKTLGKVLSSLGVMPFSDSIESICRNAYEKNGNLADATRYFYNEIFGEYGLVILDADDIKLKRVFSPIIEQDVFNGTSFEHVNQTNKELEALGFKSQINPREINFFYLNTNLRERIVKNPLGLYSTLNGFFQWTETELRAEIKEHPECFSPNVVMRPIYQETLLPNLAYIGGGAEVTYWLSLKSTFESYNIPFPVLMLRNSAVLVDKVSQKRIEHLGFTTQDFFKDPRDLITDYVKRSSAKELDLVQERDTLNNLMESVESKAGNIDKSLSQSSLALHTRMQNLLAALEKKMLKAEKNRFDTEMVQIFKVHQKLFPNHSLQERHENFLPYYARYGKRFLDELKQGFQVFGNEFMILDLAEQSENEI